MIHFGLKVFAVEQFTNVDMMFIWRFADELRNYAINGRFIVFDEARGKKPNFFLLLYLFVGDYLQVVFFLAGLQPLFQQVLVVRVTAGSQGHRSKTSERTRRSIYENRYQSLSFF